jgi:hypothetical protein
MPKTSRRLAAITTNKVSKLPATSTPSKSKSRLTPYPLTPAVESADQPKRLPKLPSAWQLTKQTVRLLQGQRKLFIGITLIYGALNLVLAQTLTSSGNVGDLRNQLTQGFHGHGGAIASSITTFTGLFSSGGIGSNTNNTGTYQFLLFIIGSLAIIWALRQVTNGKTDSILVRDAYYRGMYPLIPFILTLIVIGLELVPLLIGSGLYGLVVGRSIAIGSLEIGTFFVIFIGSALLTLYLLSSTFLALYIVAQPDVAPMAALRAAGRLVRGRRLVVFRKVVFLPLIMLTAAIVIMLPIVFLLPFLAQAIFFLLGIFALLAVHGYMYTLYQELSYAVE